MVRSVTQSRLNKMSGRQLTRRMKRLKTERRNMIHKGPSKVRNYSQRRTRQEKEIGKTNKSIGIITQRLRSKYLKK